MKVLLLTVMVVAHAQSAGPVRLKIGREIFAAYASVTGISPMDQEMKDLYKLNESRLPKNGSPDELSNNVVLGLTELGGSFCKKAVAREKGISSGQRLLFNLIDFKRGPSQLSAFLKDSLLDQLAISFWQRDVTPEENKKISGMIMAVSPAGKDDTPDATVQLMQILCTTYASSTAFLVK